MKVLPIYFLKLLPYNYKKKTKNQEKRMQNVKTNRNAENIGAVHTHTHTQVRLEK